MFQAQKLMAQTQVANARFTLRMTPVFGTVAVLTAPPNHTRGDVALLLTESVARSPSDALTQRHGLERTR